jgi:DNA-binding XRE family transcriptional regulator
MKVTKVKEHFAIAAEFKHVRTESHLTQKEVAAALEIPRTAVSMIESGGREVSLLEWRRLCDLAGLYL